MATFELKDEETWLPKFARGKKIKARRVRLHYKTGGWKEHKLTGNRCVTTDDERAIRHLEADPRFVRID